MSLKLVENDKIEFKSILNEKLERVVISFLNSKTGGDLYIGVADDGTILGVDNADKMQLAITDRLKNNISPTCLGLFDVYSEVLDGKTVIHIVVNSESEHLVTDHDTAQDTAQVTAQVKELILALDTAMTTAEIMLKMQLTHREHFRQSHLLQALNMQIVAMTIPEKPNSKNQKYRLTPKGMQFKNELGGGKHE